MTSRKHYTAAAEGIRLDFNAGAINAKERGILITHFSALFKSDSPRFDRDRFEEAATKQ